MHLQYRSQRHNHHVIAKITEEQLDHSSKATAEESRKQLETPVHHNMSLSPTIQKYYICVFLTMFLWHLTTLGTFPLHLASFLCYVTFRNFF